MRFSLYEFKKNISMEYMRNKIEMSEFISTVIINIVSVSYIPLLVGLYIVLHMIAVVLFATFDASNVVNLTMRFNSTVTSFYIGCTFGTMLFLTLTEGRYKNNKLMQIVMPPQMLANAIAIDVNRFKFANMGTITIFAFVRIAYLIIFG